MSCISIQCVGVLNIEQALFENIIIIYIIIIKENACTLCNAILMSGMTFISKYICFQILQWVHNLKILLKLEVVHSSSGVCKALANRGCCLGSWPSQQLLVPVRERGSGVERGVVDLSLTGDTGSGGWGVLVLSPVRCALAYPRQGPQLTDGSCGGLTAPRLCPAWGGVSCRPSSGEKQAYIPEMSARPNAPWDG